MNEALLKTSCLHVVDERPVTNMNTLVVDASRGQHEATLHPQCKTYWASPEGFVVFHVNIAS